MSDPNNYTVGWICAVKPEIVSASLFLDEEHDPLDDTSEDDHNTYTLGRIGRHNIVIAAMPHWQCGPVNATAVAKDMARTFPNLRFNLMVGIAGGIPSEINDIRLGDVVVGCPGYGTGGTLQYDYGKKTQDEDIKLTGHLNQPPQFILTAIAQLEADYERKPHKLEETIEGILKDNPRLWSKYKRPDNDTDRLYQSTFKHIGDDEESCAGTCGNSILNLISRGKRPEEQDNLVIHYGLIASASSLLKDALARDRLAGEGALCVEMEAAGLMNHIPCAVIRGICDYADTHKNVKWQGFAAMTAAAYTKDLLKRIPPSRVIVQRKMSELLNDVSEGLNFVKFGMIDLRKDDHFQKLKSWLSPADGTGVWFLKSPKYLEWKTTNNSFLWLNGIPGCGKTILSSTIIEDLTKVKGMPTNVVYFYFDFSDSNKQSLEDMLRCLAIQLYPIGTTTQGYLDSLYDKGTRQPYIASLRETVRKMVQRASELWIVIDALDECVTRREYPSEGVLEWIEDIRGCEASVHLLVTSRPEQDIMSSIKGWTREQDIIPLQSHLVDGDIRAYTQHRVREDKGLKRWHGKPEVEQEIEGALVEKADGMFRWVACQLDVLGECLDLPSVRKALKLLPRTLDETYARIIAGLHGEYRDHTKRILQFLTYCERPLRLAELVDAIAVDIINTGSFDPRDRMPDPEEIVKCCSSLVVMTTVKLTSYYPLLDGRIVNEKYGYVGKDKYFTVLQLAHYSVKEYLTSDRLDEDMAKDYSERNAKASIGEVCVAYFLQLEMEMGRGYRIDEIAEMYPMTTYAARCWRTYAEIIDTKTESSIELISRFLMSGNALWVAISMELSDMDGDYYPKSNVPTGLPFAILHGLVRTSKRIIDEGFNVNECDFRIFFEAPWDLDFHKECYLEMLLYSAIGLPALHFAVYLGHEGMVSMLLESGAYVIIEMHSALAIAARRGNQHIFNTLLERCPNVDVMFEGVGTPLEAAATGGHEEIVRMLLDKANLDGGEYTALQVAAEEGHENIIRMLIREGADVNKRRRGGSTIQMAVIGGHENIVRILLNEGANLEDEDGCSWTILRRAAERGYEGIVGMLIRAGADVNAVKHETHWTSPLQTAIYRSHEGIASMLIRAGADVNDIGGHSSGYFPLHNAAVGGQDNIVRMLLLAGADINAALRSSRRDTALRLAVKEGHEKVIRTLLSASSDTNAEEECYGALIAAAGRGRKWPVEMLSSVCIDAALTNIPYHEAFEAALSWGHTITASFLFNKITSVDISGCVCVNLAAGLGCDRLIDALLRKGASMEIQDKNGYTALGYAVYYQNETIVGMLIERGANINAVDANGGTILDIAAQYTQVKNPGIIRLLREKGAEHGDPRGLKRRRIE
ncbi:ankyrin repeat-containing domain protein [Hypoxylon trugodes]|uniref:ankyrin repeat-containing domain protein n=1 Tax=Hypoxylon trugodes TaxID=326681 RepID=UPI00218E923C|nr:ankyrin repeat-containing domain protein [Hypoxylon trugodes]KAI1383412.1 ankyrin repeat-containing domain protein [Hypoxylon trugodes]